MKFTPLKNSRFVNNFNKILTHIWHQTWYIIFTNNITLTFSFKPPFKYIYINILEAPKVLFLFLSQNRVKFVNTFSFVSVYILQKIHLLFAIYKQSHSKSEYTLCCSFFSALNLNCFS